MEHSYLLKLNDEICTCEENIKVQQSRLAMLKEQVWHCNKCNKYYPKDSVKSESEKIVRSETTFIDAGYGDDDEISDVSYLCVYKVCPVCGNREKKNEFYLGMSNTRTRR